MPIDPFKFPAPYTARKKPRTIELVPLSAHAVDSWLKTQTKALRDMAQDAGFRAQPGQLLLLRSEKGIVEKIIVPVSEPVSFIDLGNAVQNIRQNFSNDALQNIGFVLNTKGIKKQDLETYLIGWGLACYNFDTYKKDTLPTPFLAWPTGADKNRVLAFTQSIYILKNLVNAPANDLAPEDLEKVALKIAKSHQAKTAIIRDRELLTKNFPLIFTVGDSSDRRPRLIEINWGNAKNPKVTLVGKGVCFDTGGLNLKPGAAMAIMKKDMGGAAHVLALANMIMQLNLPIRLRVLIAAVENSVSGRSFRPGDVLQSRKGITVENTNTDAEGRLILADTLTYASEDRPNLIIDFATLTGSARAGLGPDIPAVFSNVPDLAEKLKTLSFAINDPVWPMPLWDPYKRHIRSNVATLHNSSSVPGDLVFSALFLQEFVDPKCNWIHLDTYAWEHTGKPGRPAGGADCGLRAVFALLENHYPLAVIASAARQS